jgi:hypothetical protein
MMAINDDRIDILIRVGRLLFARDAAHIVT